jgi:hypothetical protein
VLAWFPLLNPLLTVCWSRGLGKVFPKRDFPILQFCCWLVFPSLEALRIFLSQGSLRHQGWPGLIFLDLGLRLQSRGEGVSKCLISRAGDFAGVVFDFFSWRIIRPGIQPPAAVLPAASVLTGSDFLSQLLVPLIF